MNEIIFIVSEPPDGGYAAEALGRSISFGAPEKTAGQGCGGGLGVGGGEHCRVGAGDLDDR